MTDRMIYPTVGSTALKPVLMVSSVEAGEDRERSSILADYCSTTKYEEDVWEVDKARPARNDLRSKQRIFFSRIVNESLREEVKRWALSRLVRGQEAGSLKQFVGTSIRSYANLIPADCESFADAPPDALVAFHSSLFCGEQTSSLTTRLQHWHRVEAFVKESGFLNVYEAMQKFVVEKYPKRDRDETKYIPERAADRLDVIFLQQDIPLVYRTIYWLLRLVPNRITEVLSMTPNCLKRLDEGTYTITIPSFKQASPYISSDIKLIEVKYEGMGKLLVDLIAEQRDSALSLAGDDVEFLFTSQSYRLISCRRTGGKVYRRCNNKPKPRSVDNCNRFFSRLCDYRGITDEHGVPYSVTTHQFRHNAISDRMNSGLFRAIDIMPLTAHHNTKMIEQSYTHTSVSDIRKDNPVLFRGRIINADNPSRFDAVLAKPYAKRIHQIGICSDIRSCGSDKSKCLTCEYLVPDVDDLDYYRNELEDWKSKKAKASSCGNDIFSELCDVWIGAYETLIHRVESALTDE